MDCRQLVLNVIMTLWPIPVAMRSKARVCGRSVAGIAGSNPVVAWKLVSCVCLLYVL